MKRSFVNVLFGKRHLYLRARPHYRGDRGRPTRSIELRDDEFCRSGVHGARGGRFDFWQSHGFPHVVFAPSFTTEAVDWIGAARVGWSAEVIERDGEVLVKYMFARAERAVEFALLFG